MGANHPACKNRWSKRNTLRRGIPVFSLGPCHFRDYFTPDSFIDLWTSVMMDLTDEEKAINDGAMRPAQQRAIYHQMKVGGFFNAVDMVPVSQAHVIADTESYSDAGIAFMKNLVTAGAAVTILMTTDPGGVDPAAAKVSIL